MTTEPRGKNRPVDTGEDAVSWGPLDDGEGNCRWCGHGIESSHGTGQRDPSDGHRYLDFCYAPDCQQDCGALLQPFLDPSPSTSNPARVRVRLGRQFGRTPTPPNGRSRAQS